MLKTVDMAQGLPPCVYSNVELDNRAVSEVIDYYSLVFSEHEAGQKYLSKRGIKDIELISRLQIGFCDRSLGHQLQQLTFMEEQAKRGALQRVGLLKSSGHEFLRGALVFPFLMKMGKLYPLMDAELHQSCGRALTIFCIGTNIKKLSFLITKLYRSKTKSYSARTP